jgi:hypothetical protein
MEVTADLFQLSRQLLSFFDADTVKDQTLKRLEGLTMNLTELEQKPGENVQQ